MWTLRLLSLLCLLLCLLSMSVSVVTVVVTVAPHVKMTRHQRRCGLNSCYVTRLTRFSLCVCSRLSISQVGPICESSPGSSGSDRSKAGDNRFVSAVLDSHWEAVKSSQVGLGQGQVKVRSRSGQISQANVALIFLSGKNCHWPKRKVNLVHMV